MQIEANQDGKEERKSMTYPEFKKLGRQLSKNALIQHLWSVSVALQKAEVELMRLNKSLEGENEN